MVPNGDVGKGAVMDRMVRVAPPSLWSLTRFNLVEPTRTLPKLRLLPVSSGSVTVISGHSPLPSMGTEVGPTKGVWLESRRRPASAWVQVFGWKVTLTVVVAPASMVAVGLATAN